MKISIIAVCLKDKINKNKTAPIHIRFTQNRQIRYVSTGITIAPEDWDFDTQRIKPIAEHLKEAKYKIDTVLSEYERKITRLVLAHVADRMSGRGAVVGGTIWMTKHQIADLFGCFVAKVISNIAAVLKSGVLDESRVCRLHRYKDGGGIKLYSLEMITALAFRIDTRNAGIFRRWLMERATQHAPKYQPPITVLFPAREQALSN